MTYSEIIDEIQKLNDCVSLLNYDDKIELWFGKTKLATIDSIVSPENYALVYNGITLEAASVNSAVIDLLKSAINTIIDAEYDVAKLVETKYVSDWNPYVDSWMCWNGNEEPREYPVIGVVDRNADKLKWLASTESGYKEFEHIARKPVIKNAEFDYSTMSTYYNNMFKDMSSKLKPYGLELSLDSYSNGDFLNVSHSYYIQVYFSIRRIHYISIPSNKFLSESEIMSLNEIQKSINDFNNITRLFSEFEKTYDVTMSGQPSLRYSIDYVDSVDSFYDGADTHNMLRYPLTISDIYKYMMNFKNDSRYPVYERYVKRLIQKAHKSNNYQYAEITPNSILEIVTFGEYVERNASKSGNNFDIVAFIDSALSYVNKKTKG